MTLTRAKYDYNLWLIFTQIAEIIEAETPAQRANECADMISVLLNYIEKLGYDPAKIYEGRITNKSEMVKTIVAKYHQKWKRIVEELNCESAEEENKSNI
ncbi:MAG: hypothetical protein AABY22_20575 [Nanoarchaeota archaeon]